MLAMRPGADEYGAYYAGYIGRVPDGALLARLQAQPSEYRAALAAMDNGAAALPMAAGKWSVVEMLAHVVDTERVFAFRLLWFARGESSPLPGFDQDAWVRDASRTPPTLSAVLDELAAVRAASLALVTSLPDDVADRSGVANGQRMTVRALAWMVAGHAQHHLDALRAIHG
jgi:hypothetical protein